MKLMRKSRPRNQHGLVSFLVTMIMMIVITLIVVGFTQVVNRNRQNALDKQLSTQALYAAESGVNDVVKLIKSNPAGLTAKTTCNNTGYYASLQPQLTPEVSYPCVLVNPLPDSLVSSANTETSSVLPLKPVDSSGAPVALSKLIFEWSSAVDNGDASGCSASLGKFTPDMPATCTFGLLRADIFNGTGLDPVTMANNTSTYYLHPLKTGEVSQPYGVGKGIVIGAHCTNVSCVGTITNLPAGAYYIRLSTIYRDTKSVKISGLTSAGQPSRFLGQIKVDSTGRAVDVLRRIQVRLSVDSYNNQSPTAALNSSSTVCKRLVMGAAPSYVSSCP